MPMQDSRRNEIIQRFEQIKSAYEKIIALKVHGAESENINQEGVRQGSLNVERFSRLLPLRLAAAQEGAKELLGMIENDPEVLKMIPEMAVYNQRSSSSLLDSLQTLSQGRIPQGIGQFSEFMFRAGEGTDLSEWKRKIEASYQESLSGYLAKLDHEIGQEKIATMKMLWGRSVGNVVVFKGGSSAAPMTQKQYTVKIFGQDGTTFVTNVSPDELAGVPSFSSVINGGYSDVRIQLRGNRFQFDSFGEGGVIDFFNIVEIGVIDEDNPRGRTIYKGWMSQYEPFIDAAGNEGVAVTVMHVTSLLSASFYKDGSAFTVSHSADSAEDIGRAIIDHFNTIFGGSLISYTDDTTDSPGVALTFDFTDQKWFDALKKTGNLAGGDWWWKIDAEGVYWLKDMPASATHTFTLNKNIQMIRALKSAEKIANDVQVRYGASTYDASDATSQATYGTGSSPSGKWSRIISDSGVGDATTAGERGDKEVDDNKDAKIVAELTIRGMSEDGNGYDIESIKAGETCKIRNYDKGNVFFNDNMQIAQVAYNGDSVVLQLSNQPVSFARELNTFVNG